MEYEFEKECINQMARSTLRKHNMRVRRHHDMEPAVQRRHQDRLRVHLLQVQHAHALPQRGRVLLAEPGPQLASRCSARTSARCSPSRARRSSSRRAMTTTTTGRSRLKQNYRSERHGPAGGELDGGRPPVGEPREARQPAHGRGDGPRATSTATCAASCGHVQPRERRALQDGRRGAQPEPALAAARLWPVRGARSRCSTCRSCRA